MVEVASLVDQKYPGKQYKDADRRQSVEQASRHCKRRRPEGDEVQRHEGFRPRRNEGEWPIREVEPRIRVVLRDPSAREVTAGLPEQRQSEDDAKVGKRGCVCGCRRKFQPVTDPQDVCG